MNRIEKLFDHRKENILNVYFTAGYPGLKDTLPIVQRLSELGVDLIEIGMPYSDPMADGETIQNSSQIALKNGMTLNILMKQITAIRQTIEVPIVIMGYLNQMMQYGEERFLKAAQDAGVDGLIIPDLPMDVYQEEYEAMFKRFNQTISFLITPETSENRIRQADKLTTGFLYVVSKSSITGSSNRISDRQKAYFDYINSLGLKSPKMIGFGIHDKTTFQTACGYAHGAIIGSAFIRAISGQESLNNNIERFISTIR